jgi:hypothetical protein
MTILTPFDGRSFRTHGILPSFPVSLGSKNAEIKVKVVDAPLDYNILMVLNWTYVMSHCVINIMHFMISS